MYVLPNPTNATRRTKSALHLLKQSGLSDSSRAGTREPEAAEPEAKQGPLRGRTYRLDRFALAAALASLH
jgi:hypothetical protein